MRLLIFILVCFVIAMAFLGSVLAEAINAVIASTVIGF